MKHLFTKLFGALALVLLISNISYAQFVASGVVKDDAGMSLIGVNVLVKGTTIGTTTDLDGKFELKVPEGAKTLSLSYIGYPDMEVAVSPANARMGEIIMSEGVSELDVVVVSGLATSTKNSNLANAVAQISGKELTGITSTSTMDGAMYGKFTGAAIRSNSGAPGGGMSVKMRGVTSIFGSQQPLYIVDGVYVDNSSISLGTNIVSEAAGGGNTSSNQDDASNRIADIDPEDIETMEILKGASAAAIYGSRAAGGVVVITTKKGNSGATKIGLSQTIGFSRPIRLLGTRSWDATKVDSVFGSNDSQLFEENGVTDYEKELYDNTPVSSTTRVTLSGGSEKTTFFLGGTYKKDNGIVQNTGYEKASVRANIDHNLTKWLDIGFTNNYINSTADRGYFNNSNNNSTVGYAMTATRPWEDLFADSEGNFPGNPRVGSNPLETVALVTNREKINRYIGGLSGTVKLYSDDHHNLKLALRGGLDQYTLRSTAIFPQKLSYYQPLSSLGGVSISGTTVNTNTNLSAFLVHSWHSDNGLSFRTQLGVTQEDFNRNTVITVGTGLNGSQTNVDQSSSVAAEQTRIIQHDKGGFVQGEVNWKDRLIFTMGVRADKSSNNGDANKLYYYPKANLAINLMEFEQFKVENLDLVKLRVAYGQSGRFSNFNDRFNILAGSIIDGNGGVVTQNVRGNSEVGPERQSEIEFGADFAAFKNKVRLDVTYYVKTIDDLLLRPQIPASTGFNSQVINSGQLRNRGIEIGLNATPVDLASGLQWNTGVSFWKNKSKVTELSVPAFNQGGFAASLGQYRIEEGKSATQLVGTINPADCIAGDCTNVDPDGDGFQVYGDAEADFNMSFTNSLAFKGLELSFLLHWKQGGDNINLSPVLYDLSNTTWDYDDTNLDPAGVMTNGEYRKDAFLQHPAPYIEDASYVRLREAGLYYTIKKSKLNDVASLKFGISGRNLLNFFSYNSYDPEVSNFGGNVFANAIEVTPFPSSKSVHFHISATF